MNAIYIDEDISATINDLSKLRKLICHIEKPRNESIVEVVKSRNNSQNHKERVKQIETSTFLSRLRFKL